MVGISTPAPQSRGVCRGVRSATRSPLRDKSARSLLSTRPFRASERPLSRAGRRTRRKKGENIARASARGLLLAVVFQRRGRGLRRKSTGRIIHISLPFSVALARARARLPYVRRRATTSGCSRRRDCTSCGDATRSDAGGWGEEASVLCRALCSLVCNPLFCAFGSESARPSRVLLSFRASRIHLLCVQPMFSPARPR